MKGFFGPDVFEDYVFLNIGEHKNDALAKFEGTGYPWFEDLPKNALDGHLVGLETYIFDATYNVDFEHPEIKRISFWKEVL